MVNLLGGDAGRGRTVYSAAWPGRDYLIILYASTTAVAKNAVPPTIRAAKLLPRRRNPQQ
jgi:hypothetical protein